MSTPAAMLIGLLIAIPCYAGLGWLAMRIGRKARRNK